jgi:multidrug transporter EmrE-like cation transporter
MGALFLTLSVLFNAIANTLFKVGADIETLSPRKLLLLGLGLFIGLANTLCYIKALEKIDLGMAYPVFSAASIILIALLSLLFLKEGMSIQKAAGLVTLCIGLVILWRS